jgi:hypothetical protein
MKLKLKGHVQFEPHTEEEGVAWVLCRILDEEKHYVEVDADILYQSARRHGQSEVIQPGQQWTLVGSISPKYLREATVEILRVESGKYKVKLVEARHPMPRNAAFVRDFRVRRYHLATRV